MSTVRQAQSGGTHLFRVQMLAFGIGFSAAGALLLLLTA